MCHVLASASRMVLSCEKTWIDLNLPEETVAQMSIMKELAVPLIVVLNP